MEPRQVDTLDMELHFLAEENHKLREENERLRACGDNWLKTETRAYEAEARIEAALDVIQSAAYFGDEVDPDDIVKALKGEGE